MSEIKRYKTIAKAATVLDGGFLAVKEVVVEECDKGYLVMHTDHLAALKQLQTRCEELERERDELKNGVKQAVKVIEYASDYLEESRLNTIGHRSKAHMEMLDFLYSTPQHSLADNLQEVARNAFIDGANWWAQCELDDTLHLDEHEAADQYAQREYGAKDGE